MPILGDKVFKLNDGMNIDDDDEDEKEPLAVVRQKYSQSNSSSPSKSGSDRTPDPGKKTPRAVIARPPMSHGSKKKTTATTPKSNRKPPPLLVIDDSSSSDDEPLVTKVGSPSKPKVSNLATTPKKNGIAPAKTTPKNKTPVTKARLTGASSSPRNPFGSPNTMKQKRFQVFCNKLERLWDAKSKQPTPKNKKEYNVYAQVVVTSLQRSEIEQIPSENIRADITKRYETNVNRKKLQNMTEDEKNKYMKEKTAAIRKKQKEKELDEKKRFEDTSIDSQPLPSPKLVPLPDGFEGCNYGDVLMVISFIRSYSALLTPKEDVGLLPEEFANALVDAENGYPYLAKILLILLHTLIHDEEASFRKEMGVRLSDLELNSSTVGELVRLCLRKHDDGVDDDDEERSKSSYESSTPEVFDDDILEEISGSDFADLSPAKKLRVLVALCNRLLSSVAVENYLIDTLQQHADAVTERNAAGHEYNKLTKETKQEQEPKPASPASVVQVPIGEEPTGDDGADIASKVKRRRLMAEERAKLEAEERAAREIRKEKEYNEYKTRNRYELACKKLDDISSLKKALMRMESLGTDRYHNRYWFFGKWLPVVFVEKGWTSVDENLDQGKAANEPFIETTLPKRSSNDWLVFENVEQLLDLSNALCIRGIRESKLKERLDGCIPEIKAANEASKNANGLFAIKDYSSLPEDFKVKLVQLESSVRIGGLGGVADFENWKKDVENSVNISEAGEQLLVVGNNVRPSLLCGVLEPTKRDSDPQDPKVSKGMQRWCESVRHCQTWSRLHVLMSLLRSGIRWDRSLDHAKCRICRKTQDDDMALVCDNCNDIYHMYCLRPPLKKLPPGEWFCMSCKPRPPPRAAKQLRRNIYVDEDEDVDEEDESRNSKGQENENAEKSENCIVCGEGEFEDQSDELIVCIECSTSFHLNCHTPPLRHRPRNAWRCGQCTSGRKIHSTRLRDRMDRGPNKSGRNDVTKASANLYNSDLYDDEVSSAESGSVTSERRGRRGKRS